MTSEISVGAQNIRGWFVVPTPDITIELRSDLVHSGNASLCLTTKARVPKAPAVTQDLNVTELAGKRVRLSWFSAQEKAAAIVETRFVTTSNGDTASGGSGSRSSGGLGWAQHAVVFDVPKDAFGFTIKLTSESAGRVCYDDLELQTVASDYEEPCRNQVCGAGRGTAKAPSKQPVASETMHLLRSRFASAPGSIVNPGFEP